MKIKLLVSLIFLNSFVQAQTCQTSEVIKKAESYLKIAVGEKLFEYFELGSNSYYEYETKSGKSKWKEISKGKATKGKFINGKNINFILKHPDFQYQFVNKKIYVQLDSNLNLTKDIYVDHILKFLLRNEPLNWLTEKKIDSIIISQNLKKSIEPISKRLEFNTKSKEYYWIVFNTLYKEKCFSDEEILHINPITGIVLKHYNERNYVMHCY